MADLLDPNVHVYQGIWTNWSRGPIHGLTWTLSPTKSTLLTNTLALFVALAGGQLWNIIRFGIHQIRASYRSEEESDDSRAQQQVVLRNTDTDLGTLRLMLQLAWKSRNTRKQFSFPILIATLAVLHYGLFMLAGTFSTLASAGSTALARGKYCGVYNSSWSDLSMNFNGSSFETIQLWADGISDSFRNVELSLEYARECYDSGARALADPRCQSMIKPRLEFSHRVGKELCPFADLCLDGEEAIVFETQEINTHDDLGINAHPNDRLTYRRRTTCAVLNDTGHITDSAKSTSLNVAHANFGQQKMMETNWTYSYSNFSSLYTEYAPQSTNPYILNTQNYYAWSPMKEQGWTTFEPIPALQGKQADSVLFFLSYTGRYFEPIDDPWFAAHQLHHENTRTPLARTQYSQDQTISTLGCIEQLRFCNPTRGDCTPYLGWFQVQDVKSFHAGLSAHQNVTFARVIEAADFADLAQVTVALQLTSSPLKAADYCAAKNVVLSLKLPDDQWQIELRRWYSIALAQLQRNVVLWGTGLNVGDPTTQLVPAHTEPDRWFCDNMMINSKVYQSFSVFTLAAIVGTGIMIILLSLNIERIARMVESFINPESVAGSNWSRDHILRLKRSTLRASWRPPPPPKDHGSSEKNESANSLTMSKGLEDGRGQDGNQWWYQAPPSALGQHVLPEYPGPAASAPCTRPELPRKPKREIRVHSDCGECNVTKGEWQWRYRGTDQRANPSWI